MGLLRQSEPRVHIELPPTTAVGRSPSADLRLHDPRASTVHALIRWEGTRWTLRDLDSRNGTFLNGNRLAAGQAQALSLGDRLGFGSPTAIWTLDDDAPPAVRAISGEGLTRAGCGDLLALPDDEAPEVLIGYRPEGWFAEHDGEMVPVCDRQIVLTHQQTWTLYLPDVLPATADQATHPRCAELALRFQVSADEEHVHLSAMHPGGVLDLGARVHHYLLLTLARARLKDRSDGHSESDEGWLDQERLAARLGLSTNAFYVQTCRARAQLAEAGVLDAHGLLERRTGGQLRIGLKPLLVERI